MRMITTGIKRLFVRTKISIKMRHKKIHKISRDIDVVHIQCIATARIPSEITRDTELSSHANSSSIHHTRYANNEAVTAIKAADGAGSTLDADLAAMQGQAFISARLLQQQIQTIS